MSMADIELLNKVLNDEIVQAIKEQDEGKAEHILLLKFLNNIALFYGDTKEPILPQGEEESEE